MKKRKRYASSQDRLMDIIQRKREAEVKRHNKRMAEIDKEYWDRFYRRGKYRLV